jgi:hypothetical protein
MLNSGYAAESSLSLPVTEMHYSPAGIGPIEISPGHGDMTQGTHSNFVKIPGGFVSPPHTHTEDYYGVVVAGVVANGAEGAKDIPLPIGSYWFQKGKEKHVTKCLSATECVFFVTQPGKFDFVMSK